MRIDNTISQNRKHERFDVRKKVSAVIEGVQHEALVVDISDGSAAIELTGPEITNDMFVALYLEGSEKINGRVVRNFEGGFALEFETDKAEQAHIREEVAKFKDIVGKKTF